MVDKMTNLVVQAMTKLELPQWLPMRDLLHWRHYADHTARLRVQMQAHLGPSAKRVILSVAHGGTVPEIDDADTAQWLTGLSMEPRLLRWVACSDFIDMHKVHGGKQKLA